MNEERAVQPARRPPGRGETPADDPPSWVETSLKSAAALPPSTWRGKLPHRGSSRGPGQHRHQGCDLASTCFPHRIRHGKIIVETREPDVRNR